MFAIYLTRKREDKTNILVVDCGDPGDVPNAERTGTVFTQGGTVNYRCPNNCYRGGGTITCNSNGQWSPLPSCNSKFWNVWFR